MKPIYKVPALWAITAITVCLYRIVGTLICIWLGFRADWILEFLVGMAVVNLSLAAVLTGIIFYQKKP